MDATSEVRELAELTRSKSEATKAVLSQVDLLRYRNPPADTPYYLEYAFYLLGDVRGLKVLDLGCGSGEELIPLCQRGAHVVGLDLSRELLEVAQERLRRHGCEAALFVGSAYATGFPSNYFDVIFCMSLLHHLEIGNAKREILRMLKPGGMLIMKEPIRFSEVVKQLRKLFPQRDDVSEFEYPLDRAQVAYLMEGFDVFASRDFRTLAVPALEAALPKFVKEITAADAWVLGKFPALGHWATVRVMRMRKAI